MVRDDFEHEINRIYRRLDTFANDYERTPGTIDPPRIMRRILEEMIMIEAQAVPRVQRIVSYADPEVDVLVGRNFGVQFFYDDHLGHPAFSDVYLIDDIVWPLLLEITRLFNRPHYVIADLVVRGVVLRQPIAQADLERAYVALELE